MSNFASPSYVICLSNMLFGTLLLRPAR